MDEERLKKIEEEIKELKGVVHSLSLDVMVTMGTVDGILERLYPEESKRAKKLAEKLLNKVQDIKKDEEKFMNDVKNFIDGLGGNNDKPY